MKVATVPITVLLPFTPDMAPQAPELLSISQAPPLA